MPVITEGARAGEHIISDQGSMSRDVLTIAAGAGKLEAGTVLAKLTATGKLAPYDNTGTDGTETAHCVLFGNVDATDADVRATVHSRLCEVQTSTLKWAAGVDAAGQTAGLGDLAAKFIISR